MKQKNIVIAGAASFIGYSLTKRLLEHKYHVTCIVRRNSPQKAKLLNIGTTTSPEIIELDLNEYHTLSQYVSECDYFIPFTWEGANTAEKRENSEIQKSSRIHLTEGIKDILAHTACKCVIIPGTVAEYGSSIEKNEDVDCNPDTPYGREKYTFCKEAVELCELHGARYYHLRFFSIYGAEDYDFKFLNQTVIKMMKNLPVVLSTPCTQMWNFLYIDDLTRLIELLIESNMRSGSYNIGHTENLPLIDYIKKAHTIINASSNLEIPIKSEQQVNNFSCNVSKLLLNIDWKPEISFEAGIKKMIDHYKTRGVINER